MQAPLDPFDNRSGDLFRTGNCFGLCGNIGVRWLTDTAVFLLFFKKAKSGRSRQEMRSQY